MPVAALYGANASGKSSVFRAAHALRRIIHNGRLPFLTDIPRPDRNAPVALRIAFADPDRGIGYCRYVLSFFPAGHPPVPETDRRPRVTEEGLRMSFRGEQCLYTRAGDIAPEDEGLLGLASVFYNIES